MDKEKIRQVLKDLDELVEKGVGPQPSHIDKWRVLLREALEKGGD